MSNDQRQNSSILCLVVCILLGILAGFIAWYLLRPMMSLWASIPIGMFVAFCTSWMLDEVFCKGGAVSAESAPAKKPDEKPATAAAPLVSPEATAAKGSIASSGKTPKSKAKKSTAAPKLYKKPPSKVDDLKMIAGVGPKLEGVLHDVGVYQFEQIASWKKKDIEYVDERLKFRGRIAREQWVKQAKALAKGGEAEYLKVFGKKPR